MSGRVDVRRRAGVGLRPRFTLWLKFFESYIPSVDRFIDGTRFIYNPLMAPRTKILVEKKGYLYASSKVFFFCFGRVFHGKILSFKIAMSGRAGVI